MDIRGKINNVWWPKRENRLCKTFDNKKKCKVHTENERMQYYLYITCIFLPVKYRFYENQLKYVYTFFQLAEIMPNIHFNMN